jgi:hypothetical protein
MDKRVSDAARALARRGASKGGRARWATLTPEQRSEAMRRAVRARWDKKRKTDLQPPPGFTV